MPDITMCENITCELNKTCYRFNAKPSEFMQSYADFKPEIINGVLTCNYYWK